MNSNTECSMKCCNNNIDKVELFNNLLNTTQLICPFCYRLMTMSTIIELLGQNKWIEILNSQLECYNKLVLLYQCHNPTRYSMMSYLKELIHLGSNMGSHMSNIIGSEIEYVTNILNGPIVEQYPINCGISATHIIMCCNNPVLIIDECKHYMCVKCKKIYNSKYELEVPEDYRQFLCDNVKVFDVSAININVIDYTFKYNSKLTKILFMDLLLNIHVHNDKVLKYYGKELQDNSSK